MPKTPIRHEGRPSRKSGSQVAWPSSSSALEVPIFDVQDNEDSSEDEKPRASSSSFDTLFQNLKDLSEASSSTSSSLKAALKEELKEALQGKYGDLAKRFAMMLLDMPYDPTAPITKEKNSPQMLTSFEAFTLHWTPFSRKSKYKALPSIALVRS